MFPRKPLLILCLSLSLVSGYASAQVRWEDYRGDQGRTSVTPFPGVTSKPSFANANNATAVNNLRVLAADPANAVRTGESTDINFLPAQHHLCNYNSVASGGSPNGTACRYQALGRVVYARIRFPATGSYTLSVAHDDSVEVNLGTDYTTTDYRAASYDVPVGGLGGWTAGAESYADIGTFSAVSGSCALIRMYWSNQGGINFNRLRWRLGAGAAAVIPSSAFSDPAAAPPANCTSTITGQARSITLNKALASPRANPADQFIIELATAQSGGVVRQAITTGSGTGQQTSTGAYVLPSGAATYYLRESMAPGSASSLASYVPAISCFRDGTTVPATVVSTAVPRVWSIAMAATPANNQVVCSITNRRLEADISITKTNTPALGAGDQPDDTLVSGAATTYHIVVSNAGPDVADGAVLRDPAPTGLMCTTVTCGSPTGGAVCPAVSIAQLQGAGVPLHTLPANSSLTFQVGCTVN